MSWRDVVLSEQNPPTSPDGFDHFVCGFIAGEGCFVKANRKNRNTNRYYLSVTMAEQDAEVLDNIRSFFGCGEVYTFDRDNNHQKEVEFRVDRNDDLCSVIIPFFDEHGFRNTHKQKQYNEWRGDFVEEKGIEE